MSEIQSQLVRARINDLRLRLASIKDLLRDTLTAAKDIEDPEFQRYSALDPRAAVGKRRVRILGDKQVDDLKEEGNTQAAVARAKSEVSSGEFDSQS